MRSDAQGLFWHDTPKEKYVPTPPPRDWEAPDYLPHWEEASTFAPDWFDERSLTAAMIARETLIVDVEVFPNYFSVAFKSNESGKVLILELTPGGTLNTGLLLWLMSNFLTVGFYSNFFDLPMIAIAVKGYDNEQLLAARDKLIVEELQPWVVCRSFKTRVPKDWDHIDIKAVAPLSESLKTYAGRLHCKQMADLPFPPNAVLSPQQMLVVRWYNVNDLDNTALVYNKLSPQVELRKKISALQGVDVRSKSDAQLAEAVIGAKLRHHGYNGEKPSVEPGRVYFFKPPRGLNFQTDLLKWVYARVCSAQFVIGPTGHFISPPELTDFKFTINRTTYTMGIGGLHSNEKSTAYKAGNGFVLKDRDVASYYPNNILLSGAYPEHLGPMFLVVYRDEVDGRLKAKAIDPDSVAATGGKIIINGVFGKTSDPFSIFYAPQMMLQTTLGGQLWILNLVERYELAGFTVISANTDGIVALIPDNQIARYEQIIAEWERDSGLQTEETAYSALYSRDVNNYIAVKLDNKTKCKGVYSAKGSAPPGELSKNPQNQIVNDALEAYLTTGRPVEETIRACQDIRRFLCVRKVAGGGYKGRYLGKVVRWYYGTGDADPIIYAGSGNKVPDTDGAVPCMLLPDAIPADLDRGWYIREAQEALAAIGAALPNPTND